MRSSGNPMADERKMLIALLGDDRLSDREREAFDDMSSALSLSPSRKLTKAQSDWVERRFRQLELDADVFMNLHSEGKVPEGRTHGVAPVRFPWQREDGTLNLPKDPPGRVKK